MSELNNNITKSVSRQFTAITNAAELIDKVRPKCNYDGCKGKLKQTLTFYKNDGVWVCCLCKQLTTVTSEQLTTIENLKREHLTFTNNKVINNIPERKKALLHNIDTDENDYVDCPVIDDCIKHENIVYYYHGIQDGVAYYSNKTDLELEQIRQANNNWQIITNIDKINNNTRIELIGENLDD